VIKAMKKGPRDLDPSRPLIDWSWSFTIGLVLF